MFKFAVYAVYAIKSKPSQNIYAKNQRRTDSKLWLIVYLDIYEGIYEGIYEFDVVCVKSK
jgi:hypothetical protein